jgi:tetratricopeptide (TPR) repeat protein
MLRFGYFLWLTAIMVTARADEHAAAIELFEAKRYVEAQSRFEAAVQSNPGDARAHHYLGRLAQLRQNLELATDHLAKASALRPDDAEVQYDLGAACSLHADTLGMSFRAASLARKGRTALERAVELSPDTVRYRQALLEFYSTAPGIVGGSLAKAYEQADAISQRNPLQGRLAVAGLKAREKRYAEAMALWAEVLQEHPDHATALYRFGEAAAITGEQLERGAAALERLLAAAASGDVDRARAHWRLGQLNVRRGDLAKARAAFRAALELDPMNKEMAADLARLPQDG